MDRTTAVTTSEGRAGGARLIQLWLVTGILGLVATGCAMVPVPSEEGATVSESRARRDLGIDYLRSRRTAMAIRELKASLALDAGDPATHLWLGEAYRRKGRTELAESYLRGALEHAPDSGSSQVEQGARLNLSALLSQMGRYEESLEHCGPLSEDPTLSKPWQALNNCGWALMQLDRLQEAQEYFDDALEYFPRFGPARLNLGILQTRQGDRVAAIRTLERALESTLDGSGRAEARYRLGELCVALGRREDAVEHFRMAAKRAPNLEWGSQSQAYLDLLR